MTAKEVASILKVNYTHFMGRVRYAKDFPPARYIGRLPRWIEEEVMDWATNKAPKH